MFYRVITLLTLIMLFNSFQSNAHNNSITPEKGPLQSHLLSVQLTNIKTISGVGHLQLFNCVDKKRTIDSQPIIFNESFKIEHSQQLVFTRTLPTGLYGLRLYQDVNLDGKLNLSPNQIPIEPVGFSNNPSLVFGIPELEHICFRIEDDLELKVKLKHNEKISTL